MTERLQQAFASTTRDGSALFIPYVTAGYPTHSDTVPVLLAMQEGGADVIEVGIPFSDPLADGATVEHANHIAVQAGVTYEDCLSMIREAREQGLTVPVLMMGYLNPLLSRGLRASVEAAATAGVDGFIIVDMPPDEAAELYAACQATGLSLVPLVAPTSAPERIALAAGMADTFLYCVSVTGTTGERSAIPEDLPEFLDRVHAVTDLPVAVGFGISRPEHASEVGSIAEAVVVGSAIIRTLDSALPEARPEQVRAYVAEMSGAAHRKSAIA